MPFAILAFRVLVLCLLLVFLGCYPPIFSLPTPLHPQNKGKSLHLVSTCTDERISLMWEYLALGAKEKSELGQLSHVNQRQPSTGTNGVQINPPPPTPATVAGFWANTISAERWVFSPSVCRLCLSEGLAVAVLRLLICPHVAWTPDRFHATVQTATRFGSSALPLPTSQPPPPCWARSQGAGQYKWSTSL